MIECDKKHFIITRINLSYNVKYGYFYDPAKVLEKKNVINEE